MSVPDDLYYTKEHEWLRQDGSTATVGITDHAQDALGDIVFIELPMEGESVSDIFAPVSGKVAAVNHELEDNPETVNKDPYGGGWLIKIQMSHPEETEDLLSAEDYQAFLAEEK